MNVPESFLPYVILIITIALLVLFFLLGIFEATPTHKEAEREASHMKPTDKHNH